MLTGTHIHLSGLSYQSHFARIEVRAYLILGVGVCVTPTHQTLSPEIPF